MKSRTLILITAMTLFAALAMPLQLAAQDSQDHNHRQHVRYALKVLDTLGGTFGEAVGINNRGSLAGISTLPGDNVFHAFLWKNGLLTDVGTLGGPNSVAPEAEPQPNERGEVAGASDTATPDPNGEDFCGVGTHLICLPFIWEKGALTALPTLGGNNGLAWQINNRGQVIGTAENTTQDPNCTAFALEVEPVIWEMGKIQELPTISGDLDGFAQAINDRGQAVGVSTNCPSDLFVFPSHAVLWMGGPGKVGVMDLGNLGSTMFNIAFGINSGGQVVGQSGLTGNIAFHAFIWQDGAMTDLGTLPGDLVSWAETINIKGEAVGTSFDANKNMHPFVWRDGIMTDLNTLIPRGSPWLLLEALGNNDRGQIVGYALQTATGDVHAYVLTPCDEDYADKEGCEDQAEGTTALRDGTDQNPQFVVPAENVRKLLLHRLGFGRSVRNLQNTILSDVAAASRPNVTLSPTSLTFPTQVIGTVSAAKIVTLKNTGTARLTITNITITGTNVGDFAQTHTCGTSLAVGGSCSISVTFKPTGSGTRAAALSIIDNAPGSPQRVPLSGMGVAGSCIPQGGFCFGPGPNRCCPAPRGHHSFCSNPTGWGTCVES